MSKIYTTIFFACLLLLSGCGKDAAETDKTDTDIYARVPADTAFFYTNTEDIDPELQQFAWQQLIVPMRAALESIINEPPFPEDVDEADVEQFMGMQKTLLGFLNDVETPEQWEEKTGLSKQGQILIYAQELFPVISLPVADQAKLEALILDAVDTVNLTAEVIEVDTIPVNTIHAGDDDIPVKIYWHIAADRFTMSTLPDAHAAAYLGQIFGADYPVLPMTAAAVEQMNQQYGFANTGSGFIKPPAIYNVLADETTQTHAMLAELAANTNDDDLQQMLAFVNDPICSAEMNDLLSRVPQISLGLTEFTRQAYNTRIVTALDQRSKDLMQAMIGDAPIGNDPGGLFNMAVNINVGNTIKAMRTLAENSLADPFQCPQMNAFNDTARQIVEAANTPLPPFVGNMTGFAMQVAEIGNIGFADDNFDAAAMLDQLDASFALYTGNAQMLLGMGQMFLPQLNGVDLQPGAEPQPIDVPDMGMLKRPVYAALTEKAIGISYGDSSTAGLAKMLQGSDAGSDTMLTAGIDVRRYNQLYKDFIQQTMASTAAEEDDPEAYQQAQSMQKLFEDSSIYTQQFGQSFNTLRINEDGLTLDSSQELNLD
jgi:hypothetical protein